ncbi:hypothetical protein F4560_000893 [Saccharothrix ecbatanensis]|uniref:AbiTii domain-containing protein n=1 Tax=Saccharothrix ecbatanensis TaxID=1105145 RepID=A0A7W9HF74_9PSEU|nr:hypothetical protein [Saccharothrix ecbatanensis]MBB5801125.1 hypothetical protein [Saccharothrix ecbatanensis]
MKKRDGGLLSEIERGALDDRVSITTLLRKCIALGGRAGSEKLRDWAQTELDGYKNGQGIPQYRRVPAIIAIDGLLPFGGQVKGEQISRYDLPDFVQEHIGDEVPFGNGIAHLEELANSAEDHFKLALPDSATLIKFMHDEMNDPSRRITRLYWVASRSSIKGVVEHVRTALVKLVAEMIAVMPNEETLPSKEAADQAVNVVFNGGRRNNISFVNSQASGGGTSSVQAPEEAPKPEGWWQRLRRRGLFVVLSTIAAAAIALFTWIEWKPWA